MTFPQTPPPVKGELYIDGAWVDVTSYIRGAGDISIKRGRSGEQNRLTASSCELTLNNRDGRFTDRNPSSPYYLQLVRNLPIRIGVTDSAGMALVGGDYFDTGFQAQTTDKAALDITGDIDIRLDINPTTWTPKRTVILASKYVTTGDQRSWIVLMSQYGTIGIYWSATGSSTLVGGYSTAAAATFGRKAIKIVVDVDNGAGGNTITFSTASTIGGSYSALGSAVVNAGTSSIYSSSAPLAVGNGSNANIVYSDTDHFSGKYYGFELRNSAGTLVADADFTAQSADATSWSDGLGNTWDVSGTAAQITAENRRFIGEVSSMPVRWDRTGLDVFNPLSASGIIQRLTQGVSPLRSPIYRNFNQRTLTGWYPGEDESGSTTIASAIPGVSGAYFVDVTPSSDTEMLGSDGVLAFNSASSYMSGEAKDTGSNTGSAQFLCYFRFPSTPGSDIELVSVYMTGGSSLSKFTITVTSTTYRLDAYDLAGASVLSTAIAHGSGAAPNQWLAMKVDLETSGGNIAYAIGWYPLTSPVAFGGSGTFAGTVGRIKSFIIWDRTGRDNMRLSHLYMSQVVYDFVDSRFIGASNGYVGETALDRLSRLCEEESVTFVCKGKASLTEEMGRQTAREFMELVYECVDLDGGILFEPREVLGLGYVPRNWIRNVTGPQLDYSTDLIGQPEPTDDDLLIRNDVTVSRPFGSSSRATLETGRMSVLPSTQGGAGRFVTNPSLNAYLDSRLKTLAQYLVQLGTIDEMRWAGIEVNLARSALVSDTTLSEQIKALDLAGNLGLTSMPSFLPPNDADMLIQGITETISNSDRSREWTFRFNTSPYEPYRTNDLSLISSTRYQAGGGGANTLTSDITSDATSFSVDTAAGSSLFARSADIPGIFPLDITVGGETMTVSAITGLTSPQTFTISARSVNGIIKAHLAGTVVDIVNKFDATI